MKQKLLILLATLMATISTYAGDFEVDGINYLFLDDPNNVAVSSGVKKYTYKVTIPASVVYNGTLYNVTSIAPSAFGDCSNLTSVTIPNSVTSIGHYAFYGCSNLTSVVIPNSVTSIGSYAFYGCRNMTSVTISNSVTSISSYAFRSCMSLTSVTIPNSVTYIGASAFDNCISLQSVTIPNSVISIGDSAFGSCYNLTSVTIPNSVTSIGRQAFFNCSGLTSVVIPSSVTSIGEYAFYYCSGLTSVVIPNSVTSIGDGTFNFCSNLTSVVIPNSVTSIGAQAFYGCSNLTSVVIPNSVTSIGTNVFDATALYKDESNWENGVLYIGNHLIRAKSDQIIGDFTVKSGVLTLAGNAFNNCSNLTLVTIPNSVTTIGDCAFIGCTGLTEVTIPNSVTTIGSSAFSGCSNLSSVAIPNSVTSIGSSAFNCCYYLTSVTIPNSVTSIGESAFSSCFRLASVIVNNSDPSVISCGAAFRDAPVASATLYVPEGSAELYAASDVWNAFGAIVEIPSAVNLVDGQPYTGSSDKQGVDINYTRDFAADIWQPLYVPFNMSYDEWKDYGRVAELACVHAYDDGRTTIEFVTVNGGELLPNVPYVFLPNAGGEVTFTGTDKVLKAAPEEGSKYIMCSSPRNTFKIYGNYQPISGSTLATYGDPEFKGAYVMTTDNKFQHCSPTGTLKPYRFYFTREKTQNGYWGLPSRDNAPATNEDDDVIYLMVDGEVCGIANIMVDDVDNNAIYDIMGREVKNPSNGIYIQNGKKNRIY